MRRRFVTAPILAALSIGCGHPVDQPADTAAAIRTTGWGKNVTISHGDGTPPRRR